MSVFQFFSASSNLYNRCTSCSNAIVQHPTVTSSTTASTSIFTLFSIFLSTSIQAKSTSIPQVFTMVDSKEALAIAQLAVYIPVLICTIFIIFRHGFNKQVGWRFLGILCLVRIVGSCFEIAAIHHLDNKTDVKWSAILQSVGITPLLLTALGLLK